MFSDLDFKVHNTIILKDKTIIVLTVFLSRVLMAPRQHSVSC